MEACSDDSDSEFCVVEDGDEDSDDDDECMLVQTAPTKEDSSIEVDKHGIPCCFLEGPPHEAIADTEAAQATPAQVDLVSDTEPAQATPAHVDLVSDTEPAHEAQDKRVADERRQHMFSAPLAPLPSSILQQRV